MDEAKPLTVKQPRRYALAETAMKPWHNRLGYIPQLEHVLASIDAGIALGETIVNGKQRWTYLGDGAVLYRQYATGYVWTSKGTEHPLIYQTELTLTDALLETLLVYKAQGDIARRASPGVAIISHGGNFR